jgi:hypothetical protein
MTTRYLCILGWACLLVKAGVLLHGLGLVRLTDAGKLVQGTRRALE